MTTIINSPKEESGDSSAFGVIAGILMFILLASLFIFYGMPQLKNANNPASKKDTTEINVTVPKINQPEAATTPVPATGGQ